MNLSVVSGHNISSDHHILDFFIIVLMGKSYAQHVNINVCLSLSVREQLNMACMYWLLIHIDYINKK